MPSKHKSFKAVLVPQSADNLAGTKELSAEFRKLLSKLAEQHLHELAQQQMRLMATSGQDVPGDVAIQLSSLRDDIAVLRHQVNSPKAHPPPGQPAMIVATNVDSGTSQNQSDFQLPGEIDAHRTSDESEEEAPATKPKSSSVPRVSETPMRRASTMSSMVSQQPPKSFYYRTREHLSSATFDLFVGMLVLINVFFMFLKCHYDGLQIGYELQEKFFPNETLYQDIENWQYFPVTAEAAWPGMGDALPAIDMVFSMIFTVDVTLKIVFLGLGFWTSSLNVLDFFIVGLGLYALASPNFNNPSYMRMLRLAKIGRLAGALKNSPAVQSLQMLLKCISNCVHTLGWSLCVLLVIQSIMGLFISSVVQNLLTDEDTKLPMAVQTKLFYFYGTFSKTMMTMFQILFANWIPCARILVDNVSEWYAAFFIFYRCLIGFAVLNVVKAVFVQSTMKVAQQDQELLIAQKQRQSEANAKNLRSLFAEIDESGDGELSYDELMAVVDNPKMKLWMSALEIDTHDLQALFLLLDDGDGNISIEEFMRGIGRLKGPAKAIDMAGLMASVNKMQAQISDIQTSIKKTKR